MGETNEIIDEVDFTGPEDEPVHDEVQDESVEQEETSTDTETDVVTETETTPEKEEITAETRAKVLGWAPKEEWRGDPSMWVDAETFLKRGETVLPLAKRDKERLFNEVASLKQTITDLQDYHKKDRERIKEREYNRALEELKLQQRQAVADADEEAFERADKKIDELRKEHEDSIDKDTQPQTGKEPETLTRWREENPWFNGRSPEDQKKTMYAKALSNAVLMENPQWVGTETEFYNAVKEKTEMVLAAEKRKENPRRDDPPTVVSGDKSSPVGRAGKGGKKTFADLPPEAKNDCLRLERTKVDGKPIVSREQFVKDFFDETPYAEFD